LRLKIKQIVSATFSNEAKALDKLQHNNIDGVTEAVEMIYHSKGRVVVCGLGKSALIAKKIVATLNSTGTKAIFLHAADALHGDVGMVDALDIIILLSKSGNTQELKVLLPLLKANNNKTIAVTANNGSYLAQNTDHKIVFEIEEEACAINLAPTTSTTVQMVIGDAIANSLLYIKGFTTTDFFKFHPAGSLGKKIYLRVSDLVDKNNLPVAYINDSIKTIIIEMSSKRLGAVVILGLSNNIAGIITDGDLRRMLENTFDIENYKAIDIMNKQPITINENTLAAKVLNIMKQKKISQIIVTAENNSLTGLLHVQDILKEGII